MAHNTLPQLSLPGFPQTKVETRVVNGDAVLSAEFPQLLDVLKQPPARTERYFAIVIKADSSLGGLLSASTNLGNYLREREKELLPPGARITRSIEIGKDLANRAWVGPELILRCSICRTPDSDATRIAVVAGVPFCIHCAEAYCG